MWGLRQPTYVVSEQPLLSIVHPGSSMAVQGASSSLSSTSSSIRSWTHDVFLSFRGEDVRQKFISHLYHALHHRGINTCIDKNLERGEEISPELFKAIERSMISIILLSKNYSESKWCLDELLKILECKEKVKQIVLPLFYDVSPSEVKHQKGNFGEAFAKLGCKIKDEVKVTEWKVALQKVANFFGFTLGDRNESEFIQDIIKWVDSIMVNRTFLNVAKYPIGIESRARDIYQHLSIGMNDIICMVGIFGTGGIGKTTISKEIYNRISYQFEGSCFLKNIRETSKAGGLIQLQKTLLSEILGISLDFHDIDRGINVIRHRLCSKRVLLILDDVDELVQLETLAGALDWFGSGSRIIITTRDQHLLNFSKVVSKYELKILANDEALKLFSLHAFEKDEPLDDYAELSKQVLQYAQGLPLALTVIGSTLKDQSIHQWKSLLNKYKQIPDINIQSVLRVSHDGLEDNEKDMFLDIACFFKGRPLTDVIKIFDNCGFSPDYGIRRLVDKCLITVDEWNKIVWMHDLLQYMGREIVRLQSPKEPGERSRLWFHEDVRHVLEESTGTNKIEGIIVEMLKGEEMIILSPKAFEQMKRLRVFINRNASFSSGPNYLSNELRVLDWFEYPLQSFPPNFHGKKLVIFQMHSSFIRELSFIKCSIKFKDMTIMRFHDCNFLTKVPDLSSVPNLRDLDVQRCTSLVEVHDSVGSLENLFHLSFFRCSNLRIFPRSLKLRSLDELDLRDCSSLRSFPEILCEMKSLRRLHLERSAVEELPLSIGNLTGLQVLFLCFCKSLMHLPIKIILPLQHLIELGISDCINLPKKMGDDRKSILAIESPTMEDNISSSEEQLQGLVPPTNSSNGSSELQVLNCRNCFQSESNFFPISSLFTKFNFSATLAFLNLSGSQIVSLPTSIKGFVALIELCLRDCKKLEEILELPPNIKVVFASGYQSLERFPELSRILEFNGSHNRSLFYISLDGCNKMHVKIWNYKVPNPLLWKGHYNATVLPENEIPEWFQYHKEFLENEITKRGDDDVQLKGNEELVINIEGPHYLEDISGIVIYVVTFFNEDLRDGSFLWEAKVIIDSSNCVCHIDSEEHLILTGHNLTNNIATLNQYEVWIWYFDLKSSEVKVSDNLRVQLRIPPDPSDPRWVQFWLRYYVSWGANVVYKHESRAHERRKMD